MLSDLWMVAKTFLWMALVSTVCTGLWAGICRVVTGKFPSFPRAMLILIFSTLVSVGLFLLATFILAVGGKYVGQAFIVDMLHRGGVLADILVYALFWAVNMGGAFILCAGRFDNLGLNLGWRKSLTVNLIFYLLVAVPFWFYIQ